MRHRTLPRDPSLDSVYQHALIKKDMEEQRLRWEAEEAARVPEKTRKKRGRVR